MAKVGVSIMDADFGCLQKEVEKVSNADFLHYDIGDAHFVTNLFGATQLVSDIKTEMKKMVHLMVSNPETLIEPYAKAGADIIVVHLEATNEMDELIKHIKKQKVQVGIALNPDTKLHWVPYFLDKIDYILLMTVNPGYSGAEFLYPVLDKITELRETNQTIPIAVDGGINAETGKLCALAGADILISSSFVYKHENPREAVELLKSI